ncbi:MAG: T9SS type A sorting domain-containing protein [Saprospiraceae bacterium]|nr:T9SS type A sorting domain-containing protein [Saprospiraceae bacterium]
MPFYFLLSSAVAQCPFTPTVTGNLLVCPEGSVTLGTQVYDGYQWYARPFSGGTAQPISGATGPTHQVGYNDTPLYISIEATLNGCTERSAEVLVDGLVFLPLVVQSTGNFTTGPNGEAAICAGDTMFLTALQPYTLNFKWYDDNDVIPGADGPTLAVTRPGLYWLTASPGDCPDLTVGLGVVIEVVWSDVPGCAPSSVREPRRLNASVAPNPARDFVEVNVTEPGAVELLLLDVWGRLLRRQEFVQHTILPTADLPGGAYVLQMRSEQGTSVLKLIKR